VQEVDEAIEWIRTQLVTTGKPGERANLFETTIRIVGGLLSAAHLHGGGEELLKPAVEIAVRLLSAFNTASGVPLSDVNLNDVVATTPAWTTASSLSEVSTLSMEFSHVARVRCLQHPV
jgi:endoplasmic reticulum Man9GlcNAc2 1,2-alpha-mannosidase